jgi:hypothetical protein
MADLRELGLLQPLIAACSALVANPAPRDPRHGRGKPGFPDRWLARDSLGFLCQAGQTQRFAFAADRLACLCGPAGTVPVATIQTLSVTSIPLRQNANSSNSQSSIPKQRRHCLPRAHPMG